MNRKNGFTLIELLITITVAVVLLTLTVVGLRSSQATARDEKRKTDVTIIAQNLEAYYKSGSTAPVTLKSSTVQLASVHFLQTPSARLAVAGPEEPEYLPGQYPSTTYMSTEAKIKIALRDLDPSVLRAPDVPASSPVSLVVATNANVPTPDTSTYVYQPLYADGTLCDLVDTNNGCRKFNLYYQLETNATLQKITSKNQ